MKEFMITLGERAIRLDGPVVTIRHVGGATELTCRSDEQAIVLRQELADYVRTHEVTACVAGVDKMLTALGLD